jgi:hypothetical protein
MFGQVKRRVAVAAEIQPLLWAVLAKGVSSGNPSQSDISDV